METRNSMRSLSRAIQVIMSFTPNELQLSVADIARKVGIPKSTAYRIVQLLTKSRLLEYHPNARRFSIGPELYVQGSLFLISTDIPKAADAIIKLLNDLTSEVVAVGIRDGNRVTVIMREESKHSLRFGVHVGSVFPIYVPAMGKALLSELTEAEIYELLPEEKLKPLTPKTVGTRTELKRELKQIKKTGIAFSMEQGVLGVESVAAIIRDGTNNAVAAISIGIPVVRMNEARRNQLATLVRMGASLVSYQLGYRGEANPVRELEEIQSWWEQNQLEVAHL